MISVVNGCHGCTGEGELFSERVILINSVIADVKYEQSISDKHNEVFYGITEKRRKRKRTPNALTQ